MAIGRAGRGRGRHVRSSSRRPASRWCARAGAGRRSWRCCARAAGRARRDLEGAAAGARAGHRPSGPAASSSSSRGEVVVERDAERCVERLRLDAEVAHQLGDERPAQRDRRRRAGSRARRGSGPRRGRRSRCESFFVFCANAPATSPMAETPSPTMSVAGLRRVAHEVAMQPPRRRARASSSSGSAK